MSQRTRPRIMGMPRRYIQGPGTLNRLGEVIAPLGARVAVVADNFIWDSIGTRIKISLAGEDLVVQHLPFAGECTESEITRLASIATEIDCVLAVGGGKAIDTAKGVAMERGLEVVIFPTIASNDSPTSRLLVVYSENHVLERARRMEQNPTAVVVDTEIIIGAPRRFLLAGIGDALSKIHEAGQSNAAGAANFFDGTPTVTAMAISRCCDAVIRNDSAAALEAQARGVPDDAFERLVEATILMSGLAFENGGLSVAHAVLRGFSALPGFEKSLHGEQVAVGLLIQLLVNPDTVGIANDLVKFYREIGLPATLAELGAEVPAEHIAQAIADHTFENAPYVRNVGISLDRDMLASAIIQADCLGRNKGS